MDGGHGLKVQHHASPQHDVVEPQGEKKTKQRHGGPKKPSCKTAKVLHTHIYIYTLCNHIIIVCVYIYIYIYIYIHVCNYIYIYIMCLCVTYVQYVDTIQIGRFVISFHLYGFNVEHIRFPVPLRAFVVRFGEAQWAKRWPWPAEQRNACWLSLTC